MTNMKEKIPHKANTMIAILLNAGFGFSGKTRQEHVKFITKDSYPLAGALATFGGRSKFRRGDWRVTIGARTVSFYQVLEGQATNFRNFKTSDVEGVKKFIECAEVI
jgi:hypothetical protein